MKQLLLEIVQDVIALNLSGYDSSAMQGYPGCFRIRKGKIRILFCKKENKGEIWKIDFRGDVYKEI